MIWTNSSQSANPDVARAYLEYFRCPAEFAHFSVTRDMATKQGFFRFGPAVCFGEIAERLSSDSARPDLCDVLCYANASGRELRLPFNPTEVADNLRLERYVVRRWHELLLQNCYYYLRPLLPLAIRKRLQRRVSRSRRHRSFPNWPVDCSIEQLFRQLMTLMLEAETSREIPFIWFWPNGYGSAVMLTHDVEKEKGASECESLMDIDDSYGMKAAFQLIPERAYKNFDKLASTIRERGFELNIHDLDHDGRLYCNENLFSERARKINQYGRQYGIAGFRAGSMHRNQGWFDLLQLQYDMSVPNVSHLEPQKGGCCTVMPYFVGSLLELPLTTVQDHGLFFILDQYSTNLWKQQIALIASYNGLISFIVHPDYIVRKRERDVYCELLEYLKGLRQEGNTWFALPAEINDWWRCRSQMRLVRNRGGWQICGNGSDRARLAFATISGGKLEYRLAQRVGTSKEDPTTASKMRVDPFSAPSLP